MNTILFSWKEIKSYPKGSPADTDKDIQIWSEKNVTPILKSSIDEMKSASTEIANYFSNFELKAHDDLRDSLKKDDIELLNILMGLHEAVTKIRKYNAITYTRIVRMYFSNGFARVTEIHKIFADTFPSTFVFLSNDEELIENNVNEYLDAVKVLISFVYALRLWIYKISTKLKILLDIDAKCMIANRIYKILIRIFNVTVYGNQMANLNSIITSSGAFNLFNKLKKMRDEDRIPLIEVDPFADEDDFIKVDSDSELTISDNTNPEPPEINEKFYNHVVSLPLDELKSKVLYYYNTYKGSSKLIPIMGEFGSIEFANLILLIDYYKSLIDKERDDFDASEFFKDLNLKCLITMGFAFNHMPPGEFSDELDKIIKPYPGIMKYPEWSKVYRYLRDNHGDWIHDQEFAYGTQELRDDPINYNKHYVLFLDAYNQMEDCQTIIRFYKRQGLKPDFCSSYFPFSVKYDFK